MVFFGANGRVQLQRFAGPDPNPTLDRPSRKARDNIRAATIFGHGINHAYNGADA